MLHFPHFERKPCSKFRCSTNQGCRQRRASGARSPFHVWHPGCCIRPYSFKKRAPLWFSAPLARKSWRRTCNQRIPYSRWPPCNLAQGHVHSVFRKIILWYSSTLPTASMVKYKRGSTREICDLYAKCEELLISAASMREHRKLGNREKAFWWQSGCCKVFCSVACSEWWSIRCQWENERRSF